MPSYRDCKKSSEDYSSSAATSTQYQEIIQKEESEEEEVGVCFGCATITIDSIPPEGLLLDHPGNYVFAHDLTYNGSNDAITIASDNVLLNLCNHSLVNLSKKSESGVGIRVKANLHQAKIIKGNIENFAPYGLVVESGNEKVGLFGLYFRNNGIEDWTGNPAESGAFLIEGSRTIRVMGLTSTNNHSTGGVIRNVTTISVVSSNFLEQKGHIAIGLLLEGTKNRTVYLRWNNYCGQRGIIYSSGLELAAPRNEIVYDSVRIMASTANDNVVKGDQPGCAYGISISGVDDLLIGSVSVSGTRNKKKRDQCVSGEEGIATGIYIAYSKDINFTTTGIKGVRSHTSDVIGVHLKKCEKVFGLEVNTMNIETSEDHIAFGWLLDRVKVALIRECSAMKTLGGTNSTNWYFYSPDAVRILDTSAFKSGRGYFVDGRSRGITLEANYADGHKQAGFSSRKKNKEDLYIRNISVRGHPNFGENVMEEKMPIRDWKLGEAPSEKKDAQLDNMNIVN